MQFTLAVLPALAALVAAAPQPQVLNFAAVQAAPAPTVTGPTFGASNETNVYNSTVAAAAAAAAVADNSTVIAKRTDTTADCAPQPDGYGPVPFPNTVSGFQNYPVFDAVAISALAPLGYKRSFVDYSGSMTGAGYLGLYTLNSYSVSTCAAKCNSVNGCLGFNLFYERNPTLFPAAACPNPTAFTNIKCTLWGVPTSKAAATNFGQYRAQFQVVIAGSNGYNLVSPAAAAIPTFNAADILPGAINNAATYIGSTYYNQPYDPSVCASVCKSLTASNKAAAQAAGANTYVPCNYVNSFVLAQNSAATGMYCMFHSAAVAKSAATNVGGSNAGVSYSFSNSLGYALSAQDAGTC